MLCNDVRRSVKGINGVILSGGQRQKRLKMRVQFILDEWRPLTMATELGVWAEYEEEDWGSG
ncbi:hypothetical protein EYF80_038940 [Liparis tanakae]|uniref:Uncharacterized protein n=1 Tax=Liparis tanakae TaxID=230148 RepID=A0A4Z2GB53_9TELE|nr:hypothetical protein EYF80_038940 [Liparis tanakae]